MKRYGAPKKECVKYTERAGSYAILLRHGRLLLTYQGGIHNEYQLPGGGIDPGESPLAALHREVLEETGWRISKPHFIGAFRRYAYMPDYDLFAEKICRIYFAFPVRKICDPIEQNHREYWCDPQEALSLIKNEGDRRLVQSFCKSPNSRRMAEISSGKS